MMGRKSVLTCTLNIKLPHIQNRLEPVYETLPGWRTSTLGAVSRNDLPGNAVSYISRLEELVGVPVSLVSTGPERNHIVPMNP